MQMKRLEERLERPIFARDGRASKLTEDGERLLDYARRIVKLNIETIAAFSYTAFSYILINLRRGYKVGSFGIQKPSITAYLIKEPVPSSI